MNIENTTSQIVTMMETKTTKYSTKTAWLHWVSALLIIVSIFTGIIMEEYPHTKGKLGLYLLHFVLGGVVFILTFWRTTVLFKDARPKSLHEKGTFLYYLMNFVHIGFYIGLTCVSISGFLSLFVEGIMPAISALDFAKLPEMSADGLHPLTLSHKLIGILMFLLLIVHIGGFIVHLIRKKENTLKRIIPTIFTRNHSDKLLENEEKTVG